MKPQHVLDYANQRIDALNLRIAASHEEYAKAKAVYEAKFLTKLLGGKFENSFKGDTSWMGSWNFIHLEHSVNQYKALRDKATYHVKMGYNSIDLGSEFSEANFYKWCNDNSIPF